MLHTAYISPDFLDEFDLAVTCQRGQTDGRALLEEFRKDARVALFHSTQELVNALNDDRVSDQGYFVTVDDRISTRDELLALIKEHCIHSGVPIQKNGFTQYVIDLLPDNSIDYDEAQSAMQILHAELPIYMVASDRNGEWFEEKVLRVACTPGGSPEFQLEDGQWLDSSEPFEENLLSVEYILKSLCPSDVKEFHEKYARKERTFEVTIFIKGTNTKETRTVTAKTQADAERLAVAGGLREGWGVLESKEI